MASLITDTTDGMFVRPRGSAMCNSGPTTAPYVVTDTVEAGPAAAGALILETANLFHTILPVESVTTTNTLTTGIPGLVLVLWQANDTSADRGDCFVSDLATGEVTFSHGEGGTIEGWIHCFHSGASTQGI